VISWPEGKKYPWAPYYVDQIVYESTDIQGSFMALHRILRYFKKDKFKKFSKARILIDNVAVGSSETRQKMLEYLKKFKIINIREQMYILDIDKAGQLGINWTDLREQQMTNTLYEFLEKFTEWAKK